MVRGLSALDATQTALRAETKRTSQQQRQEGPQEHRHRVGLPSSAVAKLNNTDVIAEASRFVHPEGDQTLNSGVSLLWRMGSAAAHGQRSYAVTRAKPERAQVGRPRHDRRAARRLGSRHRAVCCRRGVDRERGLPVLRSAQRRRSVAHRYRTTPHLRTLHSRIGVCSGSRSGTAPWISTTVEVWGGLMQIKEALLPTRSTSAVAAFFDRLGCVVTRDGPSVTVRIGLSQVRFVERTSTARTTSRSPSRPEHSTEPTSGSNSARRFCPSMIERSSKDPNRGTHARCTSTALMVRCWTDRTKRPASRHVESFTADDLECVSEIGVAVPDVPRPP